MLYRSTTEKILYATLAAASFTRCATELITEHMCRPTKAYTLSDKTLVVEHRNGKHTVLVPQTENTYVVHSKFLSEQQSALEKKVEQELKEK